MTKNDEERSDRSEYGAGTELVRSSTGNCTPISTRRCCVQHRSRNLWSVAEAQRDLTAELGAQTLRDQPGRHFK
jgi:hypothetical protein